MDGTASRRQMLGGALGAAAFGMGAPMGGATRRPSECRPRYLGYREQDRATPWARYFTGRTSPVQPQVARALAGPGVPAERVPPRSGLVEEINSAGPSPVETGYGRAADGTVWAAVNTRMPGVTAEMWDWWFGWHLTESSRYKLWHPDAHAFASITGDPTGGRPPTRKMYIGKVSFVDEYIGPYLEQLAITFMDPVPAGFHVDDGTTVIYGRVGSAILPLNLGWLCHQVRPVPGGSEMRSRFYLNTPGVRPVDLAQAGCAVARNPLPTLAGPLPFDEAFGRQLMEHCGAEMNHLAGFLPELHAEFAGTR